MTDIDTWKSSLESDIETCDEFIQRAKPIIELMPLIEEKKRESEIKLSFVYNMPEDRLYEVAPTLLPIQLNDERILKSYLPSLPIIGVDAINAVCSTAGSISPYITACHNYIESGYQPGLKLLKVIEDFDAIADEKDKSEKLPKKLSQINRDLGEIFIIARKSFSKAKAKMITVSQAATPMRDVIQQSWGGLVNIARTRNQENLKDINNLQFKKELHRKRVASCLVDCPENETKLVLLLSSMCDMYGELSKSDFGKNPMNNDFPRLIQLYREWILQLDDMVKLINPVIFNKGELNLNR